MKSQYVILGVTFVILLAISTATSVIAVDPTNLTQAKTQANATVLVENGTDMSQPRVPLPSGNLSPNNLTDTNITGR
jgi:uncharacterized lipoprotein YbaY